MAEFLVCFATGGNDFVAAGNDFIYQRSTNARCCASYEPDKRGHDKIVDVFEGGMRIGDVIDCELLCEYAIDGEAKMGSLPSSYSLIFP